MRVDKYDNFQVITASEGYKLTFRGSSSNIFYANLTVDLDYDIGQIIEVVDDNIPVYVPQYLPETYGMSLDEIQKYIISKTKILLQEFLEKNPLFYNGKFYNVTSTAQSHLSSVLKAAETARELNIPFVPMWNAIDEMRSEYDFNELQKLFIEIQNYILPFVLQQQKMEQEILSTTDKEKLLNMNISYYKED